MNNIFKNYDNLTSTDILILKYMVENINDIQNLTAKEIAIKNYISKTTIINLSKKLGFNGFRELKFYLYKNNALINKEKIEKRNKYDIFDVIKAEFNKTIFIQDEEEMKKIVNILLNKKIVYVFARGASAHIAKFFSTRLLFFKINSIFIEDINHLEIVLEHISNDEIIIFLSQSGNTEIIIKAVKSLNLKSIDSVAITSYSENLLSKYSTYRLFFHSNNLDTKIKDTNSRLGMYLVIQILIEIINKEVIKNE